MKRKNILKLTLVAHTSQQNLTESEKMGDVAT